MSLFAFGASLLSGGINAMGAKKAGSAQKKAEKRAMKAQKEMYELSRQDMMPYQNSGLAANRDLQMRMGLSGSKLDPNYGFLMKRFTNDDFVKDPGYQFRMDEGNRGISATQAARGGLLSGAAAKEAARYNQGFASNEFNNAYMRFTGDQDSQYNKLSGIKASGQRAAESLMGNNSEYGGNMASGYRNMGQIKADTIGAQTNALTGMIGDANTLFQQSRAKRQASNYGFNPSGPRY